MAATPGISSSSSEKDVGAPTAENDKISRWIDSNLKSESDRQKIIEYLVGLTLPADPAGPTAIVAPLSGSLDAQLWPWNRAADQFFKMDQLSAAAEVNAAMYLAIIALQKKYKLRFHKGMPLCNIGYFVGKSNPSMAIKAWLLGTAEDAFASPATVKDSLSFNNLLGTRVPRPALEQYLSTIKSRFIDLSITPLLPELVPDLWLNPFLLAPTKASLECAEQIESEAVAIYPRLQPNSLNILDKAWALLKLPEGVSL